MFIRVCKGSFIKASLIRSVDIMKAEEYENIDLYDIEDESYVAVFSIMGEDEDVLYGMSEKEAMGLENQLTALCVSDSKPEFLTDYVIGPWEDDNA